MSSILILFLFDNCCGVDTSKETLDTPVLPVLSVLFAVFLVVVFLCSFPSDVDLLKPELEFCLVL